MIEIMKEMVARLRTIEVDGRPVAVEEVIFPDEDHGSVQQAAVSRAVTFAFACNGHSKNLKVKSRLKQ